MDLEKIILDAAHQCESQNDTAGAEINYRGLLDSFPGNIVAAHRLGRLLFAAGRNDEGLLWLKKAADNPSASATILFDLGLALEKLRHYAEAVEIFSNVANLCPDHGEALFRLGLVSEALKRNDQARESYRMAVEAFRRSAATTSGNWAGQLALANALANHGIISRQRRLITEAIHIYRHLLALNPASAEVFCSMGTALTEVRRADEAVAAYMASVHADPHFADAYRNLGIALGKMGRTADAGDALRTALALGPENPANRFNLSIHQLMEGDFQRGWDGYECRWQLDPPPAPRRNFPQPQWAGQNPSGKIILLHAEQGLGDSIQFLRYGLMLARRGAKVILELPRPLHRLAGKVPGIAALTTKGEALPAFDLHCPLASLPLAFGTTGKNIPLAQGYLSSHPERRRFWRERIVPDGRKRVGLVWAGSPTHQDDDERSIPFDRLHRLWDCKTIRWYSLQVGDRAKDVMRAPPGHVIDLSPELSDFAETAAVLDNLDLVISVDTSVAHLAGAMGRPCWLLLPFAPDWRWLRERDDSPWYSSLRLFRQQNAGEWGPVIDRITAELPT